MATLEKAFDIYHARKWALQNFCIAENGVYTVQGQLNQFISFNRFNEDKTKASFESEMILKGCGHSQTIDIVEHKGKKYLLCCIKPFGNDKSEKRWGLQLGFIEYVPGKVIDSYKDIKRISNITNYRMECGLSTDKKTLMIVAEKTGDAKVCIHFLDLEYVLDTLFKFEGNYMSINMLKKQTDYLGRKEWKRLLPYGGSCQGVDLSDGGSIYVIGGVGIGYQPYPIIHKLRKKKVNGRLTWVISGKYRLNKKLEGEGVKVDTRLLVGTSDRNNKKVSTIFSIDKGVF